MSQLSEGKKLYKEVMSQREAKLRHKQNQDKLTAVEKSVISSVRYLVDFLDNKTTKTEVVNQLKSIKTPDVENVVKAVEKLDSSIKNSQIDLSPIKDGLSALEQQLKLIPKEHAEAPEQREDVRVTNLSEIDLKPLEKAIKALKLEPTKVDVAAPNVNVDAPDLKPLQDSMLNVIKAVKGIEIPKTDLSTVEKKLDTANKHLEEITKIRGGGGGGGGNGTPYVDAAGKPINVELETDGSVPVTVVAGGSAGTANLNTRVDKATTDIIYIGKAALGTATSAASWQIKKIDKTVTDNVTITFAAAGAFTATWNNRGSETYS